MAGLAPFVEHLPLVRGFAIVTSEAIRQSRRTELRPFRMIRIVVFAVLGHMPAWEDDWVALDRLLVDDPRVTGGAALPFCPLGERLDVLPMAHDQPDFLHGWRQVTDGDFRHVQDAAVAAQAGLGVKGGLDVVGGGGRSKDRYRHV